MNLRKAKRLKFILLLIFKEKIIIYLFNQLKTR